MHESYISFLRKYTNSKFYSHSDVNRKTNLTRDELTKMGYVDSTQLQAAMAGHNEVVDVTESSAADDESTEPMVTPEVSVKDLNSVLDDLSFQLDFLIDKGKSKHIETARTIKKNIDEYLKGVNPDGIVENLDKLDFFLKKTKL